MRTRRQAPLVATLTLAILVFADAPARSQALLAGRAQNAKGTLVVVRSDGVETRLQGRGTLQIFEGDILRVDGQGALIETGEAIQVALNGSAIVKILSRWEKGKGVTRILRLQRGEVWARSDDAQPVEVETPVGVLATREAEVSVRLVSDNEAVATVVRGTADLATPLASCRLTAGTVSSAYRGRACTQPTVADTRAVTNWSQPLLVP
ncbi:MAG: hypothetical protein ACREJV_14560 [Candidatus Rokuibacteriota bacterium]